MKRTALGIVTVVLVLGTFNQGCRRPNDPQRVTAIDSLINVADSLADRLDAIDTSALMVMDSTFEKQRDALEALFKDTLQRDTALIAGNYYRAMNRSLNRALNDRRGYRVAIEESRTKLRDLHKDASKGLWPEDQEVAFFEQEKIILTDLMKRTEIVERSLGTAQREWQNGHAVVDTLLARKRVVRQPQ